MPLFLHKANLHVCYVYKKYIILERFSYSTYEYVYLIVSGTQVSQSVRY